MNIDVQTIRFTADKKLIEFVNKRTKKLTQYLDQIIDGVCYLRFEKGENEGNKITEFKINIPGTQLFAKGQAKTFEEATDIAIESLRRQINKYKTKNKAKVTKQREVLSTVQDEDEV